MLVTQGWPHFVIGLFHSMYDFALTVIPLGGYWVPSFIICTGALQGDPLSSIFFNLGTDPL
eukprot:9267859-Pyramimonas_sp.AAC.1